MVFCEGAAAGGGGFCLFLAVLLLFSSCCCYCNGDCYPPIIICRSCCSFAIMMPSRSAPVSAAVIAHQQRHYWNRPLLLHPLAFSFSLRRGGGGGNMNDSRNTSNVKRWLCCHDSNHNNVTIKSDNDSLQVGPGTHILLWRGEGTKGYSLQFRQLEFSNAVSALLLSQHNQSIRLKRDNSLLLDDYSKKKETNHDVVKFLDATLTVDRLDDLYGAMQYVQVLNSQQQTQRQVSSETTPTQFVGQGHILKEATEHCSLVREIYSIIAVGESHEQLAHEALKNRNKNGVIARLMKEQGAGHGTDTNSSTNSLSWCLRFREYNTDGSKRFGVSKRSSMKKERQVIDGLKPLLQEFGGHVQLKDPDCALYVFQGLNGANLMLVEKIASGASTQKIAPNTRQCVTNTPLCPLSSFIMCNIGRVKEGDRVLDPYSGSCSTLLACAIIAPTSQTVGIELADDGVIDRGAIVADFESRGLVPPVGLIHGDCTDCSVREQARTAIGGGAFDVILADPPYGRREKISNGDSRTPLQQLIESIKKDAESKKPLLKRGGRLVVFVPANNGEKLVDNLPSKSELAGARLKLISQTEQPLSLTLSRWLVVFEQE